MSFTLSFHSTRTQPLSDLVQGRAAKFLLTSETPIKAHVSVMTSRGLSHFDTVTLGSTPYAVPYEAPWGRDWSALQIQALDPRDCTIEPYEVKLAYIIH
jgi:hypothetical protein